MKPNIFPMVLGSEFKKFTIWGTSVISTAGNKKTQFIIKYLHQFCGKFSFIDEKNFFKLILPVIAVSARIRFARIFQMFFWEA